MAWAICCATLDSLEQELAPYFGREALEAVVRGAGRRCGGSTAELAGPAERSGKPETDPLLVVERVLRSVPELPLERSGGSFLLKEPAPTPLQAVWLAGFLEGADPRRRSVQLERQHGCSRLRFGVEPAAELRAEDFRLPATGPLMPHQLAQVADLSDDAILFVDTQQRIRAWNKGAETLFGYRAEEAIGRSFDLLLPEDLRRRGELELIQAETERTGTLRHYVTRRRTRDGQERLVSLTRTVIRNRKGEMAGCAVILRDITEPERLKQELKAARQLAEIGEIAAQVAHEVRNPLAGIHGALQVLRRRLDPGPEEEQVFDEIAREIARLDHTVTDLLRFGRPAQPRTERVDLAAWLEDWTRRMAGEADGHRAALRLEMLARPQAWIDPVFLEQVLRNLFENALRACGHGCEIRLRLEEDGARARILFRDNGPGISEEASQPFFSAGARGAGLSLAISRNLLSALGGSLAVLPNDGGAVIQILLPRAA
ncbi:MAG: PAS domain S-box protein [Planctomycetota bacterium]|nr:MAG: PAS domain S-box protein [Planctomycetota bacterium]